MVRYVDGMDDTFRECVQDVMIQWSRQLVIQVSEKEIEKNQALGIRVNLMDTLHRMALDM
jgi:hypothetical protein